LKRVELTAAIPQLQPPSTSLRWADLVVLASLQVFEHCAFGIDSVERDALVRVVRCVHQDAVATSETRGTMALTAHRDGIVAPVAYHIVGVLDALPEEILANLIVASALAFALISWRRRPRAVNASGGRAVVFFLLLLVLADEALRDYSFVVVVVFWVEDFAAPFHRVFGFVIQCLLEHVVQAVVADRVVGDGDGKWLVLQPCTALTLTLEEAMSVHGGE
jgi:hypothetical protein